MDHFALAREMVKEEFRVLNAIELSMRKFAWVPLKNVAFYARYDPEEVQFWLDKVHKRDLLIRRTGKVDGYVINSKAYDLLALHAVAEQDLVASIGNSLGRGKESDVYQGLSPSGTRLALKFHRIGQTSFRDVKRKRDYTAGRHHVSWLYTCRLSATREAERLRALQPLGIAVPVLAGHNRHLVVMVQHEGQEIHEYPSLPDPLGIFEAVVATVGHAYREAGLIHADLGEFNIMLDTAGRPVVIDWPQAVRVDHPNAALLLRRDVENLCIFFRKHGVDARVDETITTITGG